MTEIDLPADAEGCREVLHRLGVTPPEACAPGLLANLTVLAGHLAVVRSALQSTDLGPPGA
ncbi:hypothetical protein ACO2Q0_21030 [Phenylobacterium sp. VNQ135]|uniref:hypothetical protein n=1 Tax=Phenylobacterium sp. VNQ135 TaxID=3400922 RepID=UPI003C047D51